MKVPACIVDFVESLYEFNSVMVKVYGEESEAFQGEKLENSSYPSFFN